MIVCVCVCVHIHKHAQTSTDTILYSISHSATRRTIPANLSTDPEWYPVFTITGYTQILDLRIIADDCFRVVRIACVRCHFRYKSRDTNKCLDLLQRGCHTCYISCHNIGEKSKKGKILTWNTPYL